MKLTVYKNLAIFWQDYFLGSGKIFLEGGKILFRKWQDFSRRWQDLFRNTILENPAKNGKIFVRVHPYLTVNVLE